MTLSRTPKERRCKAPGCCVVFTPARMGQKACGVSCALLLARAKREQEEGRAKRQERAKNRKALEEMKPLSYWAGLMQKAVNRYVRARDYFKGCVSCHMGPNYGGVWHASHFRSVAAAPALRFNLLNIHKACGQCNTYKSGNIAAYAPRLVELIGQDKVEWIYSQNQVVKYSREYLKRGAELFNRKAMRQEKRNQQRLTTLGV